MASDQLARFAEMLKQLRTERGLTLRELAERAHYSKSYVHELECGQKPATDKTARLLDEALDAGGRLASLVSATQSEPAPPVADAKTPEPMGAPEIEHLHDTVRHLVALDTRHGSEGLAASAARAFKTAMRRLAKDSVRETERADLYAALAELGEVAAWLAFDSEQQAASRNLATEALLVAQAVGDADMKRFLMSHLAMQAVYLDRPAEALDLAERVIAERPRAKRVSAMMRVRRARALSKLGDHTQALRELEAARTGLESGVGPGDPQWTWWWHGAELARHESHLQLAAGDSNAAVRASETAVSSLPAGQGRDQALFRADLLADLVAVGAWRDADEVAADLRRRVTMVGSARVPRIIRVTERRAVRAGAPVGLVDAIRAAADAADPAT